MGSLGERVAGRDRGPQKTHVFHLSITSAFKERTFPSSCSLRDAIFDTWLSFTFVSSFVCLRLLSTVLSLGGRVRWWGPLR